jgi:hypothetical protein
METFFKHPRKSELYTTLSLSKNGVWILKKELTLMKGTTKTLHIWLFPAGKRADTPEYRGAGVSANTNVASNHKVKNTTLASINAGKGIKLPSISLTTHLLFMREFNEATAQGRSCKTGRQNR